MKTVVQVHQNRELTTNEIPTTQNENQVTILQLEVPEEYQDFNKKIVFLTPDGIVWDLILNDTYVITNAITKYETVRFYIWLTKDNQDFRTIEKVIKFNSNVDATGEITPEEISAVTTMLKLLDEEIVKVKTTETELKEIIEDLEKKLKEGYFKGDTYTPEIGKVETLEPEEQATASIEIDADNKIAKYNFGIPKGKGIEGGGELLETIISNETCGAAPANTTFNEGMTFTDFAKKLLIKELAPSINFTSSQTGIYELGTIITNPTLALQITNKGTGTPKTIEFYVGNDKVNEQNYIENQSTYTYTYTGTITGNTIVKGKLIYEKSDQQQGTTEQAKQYTFLYPSYVGITSKEISNLTQDDILNSTKILLETPNYTYNNITANNQRIFFAYPSSYNDLTDIKDGNNFSLKASHTKLDMTIKSVSYKVYILTDPTTVNGYKLIYS